MAPSGRADRSRSRPSGRSPILDPVTTEAEAEAESPGRHRRLAWSTAIFAAATGVSRVLGLFREIVVRRYFGVEGEINAFTVAFQVPNLVRALAADMALGAAFVPVFSELLEKEQRERAWRLASSLIWLALIVLGAATGLFFLLAPWIMSLFGGPYEELATTLSRLLFPIVILMGVSGIVTGILNSYEEFTRPGPDAGVLEPHDHRLAGRLRPALRQRRGSALRLRGRHPRRHGHPGGHARLVAAGERRAHPGRARPARPGAQARLRPHAPDHPRRRAHQLQPRHQHVLRVPIRRPDARAERHRRRISHLHAPAGDLLRRRRHRPLPEALAARRTQRHRGVPGDGLAWAPTDRLPASAGERRGRRPRRPDRQAALRARGLRRRSDRRRRGRLRGLRARADLQRDDADAQPRVLQPPVGLGPDGDRAREPRPQRRPQRGALPRRGLGHSPRHLDRQHRRHRCAARPLPPATRADARPGARLVLHAHLRRCGRRRRRGLRGLVPVGRALRPFARRADRSRWAPASSPARPRTSALRRSSASASCRRCSRCAGDQLQRARNDLARPHPQLLHRGAHRPRQVDAGRPRARGHRDPLRARDARAGARLDGARARARDHDQGAGRPRHVARAPAQPDRHAGPRRLHLRGLARAPGVRGRDPRRRRGAGHRGADARQRLPRDREQPRDRPGREQDRPTPGQPRRGCGRGRRAGGGGSRTRPADLGQDRGGGGGGPRCPRRPHSAAGRRPGRAAAGTRLRLVLRPVPRRRGVRAHGRRALLDAAAPARDGRRDALRGGGARLLLP